MRNLTNMPWAVYRCSLLKRGETPKDEANLMKRTDRAHSYVVGAA